MRKINLKKSLKDYAKYQDNLGEKLNIYEFFGWICGESELSYDEEFEELKDRLFQETRI